MERGGAAGQREPAKIVTVVDELREHKITRIGTSFL
jgi:hypothetical protein